jgi:hypothetical protein
MVGALLYLEFHSRLNRLRSRLRRLRQPKYLLGAIVGGAYFCYYFFWVLMGRRQAGRGALPVSPGQGELVEGLAALVFLVVLLLMWVFPRERAALNFSEAEVAFLFPAPVGRRTLINFKLLKSQTAILLSALFMTLIRPWGGGNFLCRYVGWWVVLTTMNLHTLGSSFTRTLLLDRGVSNWQRRLLFLGGAGVAALGVVLWARKALPPPPVLDMTQGLSELTNYARQILESGPLPWLLAPFRWVVAPMFATGAREFCVALGPALALIGLQYWWVIRSDVAFEEASIELSRKFAERMAAARSGNWQAMNKPKKGKRPPFELRPQGWPAVAIFWKNLISAGHFFTGRAWFWLLGALIVTGVGMQHGGGRSGVGVMISFIALMLVFMSLAWGPQVLRHDFRQDLPAADVLKMYPMAAWQVVLGEVLAPAAILIGAQWLLLLVAGLFFTSEPNGPVVPVLWRISFGLAAALVLPFVDLIALLLPNAAALLFPAWVQLGKNAPRGMETMGQQIILMFGQVLVLLLAMIPAGLAFLGVFLLGRYFLGIPVAVDLAALAAAILLAMEAAVGVRILGKAFERLDWSDGAGE